MTKNILQLLENTTEKFPNKIAFGEAEKSITFLDFQNNAQKIGSGLAEKYLNKTNNSIVIFIDKTINCLQAMMGILYSGNFYTIIDIKSPLNRAQNIIDTLNPMAIITDSKNKSKLEKLELTDIPNIELLEELEENNINNSLLERIRSNQIDTDPAYVLFTSGSTGIPKGTVVNHNAVITYSNWVKDTFNINEETVWGSQTPFYFSMSITDVFSTILTGATLYIIPKMYFSFPVKLFEYLNEKKVNSIYWVPSALCIVANLGALNDVKLPYMKKILFAGEPMPVKQLNIWMEKVPNCMYANLFGPTETTDICSYYIVDRKLKNDESVPIGKHCDNCNLIIIDEDGREIKPKYDKAGNILGETEAGELLARGSFLASGYYGNEKKTAEVFIQNPINNRYPELVYKTGDIVKYNSRGELIYISRKDYQIKHMGYRIELGEIERNIYGIEEIVLCACIYNEETSQIVLFYQGDIEENTLAEKCTTLLLPYMKPNKYIKLERMPYNANGKIDRKSLKESL